VLFRSLCVGAKWAADDFLQIAKKIEKYEPNLCPGISDLNELKRFLKEHRGLLLNLLANPNLLEHEAFTDLLWAVFHLAEELAARKDFAVSSKQDHEHIIIDMNRAYRLILREWLSYMKHLKDNYPYLFSFAMRTNPFDASSSVEVK
jgi:hypothetical protein